MGLEEIVEGVSGCDPSFNALHHGEEFNGWIPFSQSSETTV